jgi:hypothetical protein
MYSRVLCALDGFEMAKSHPLSTLPPQCGISPYSIAPIVSPKTLPMRA